MKIRVLISCEYDCEPSLYEGTYGDPEAMAAKDVKDYGIAEVVEWSRNVSFVSAEEV